MRQAQKSVNAGSSFVWWDFDPPIDLPPNKFSFGHRVIVGLNKDSGTAYARVSFFDTLNFAVIFGTVPVETSQSVITDIDPLAKSPPNDIVSWTEGAAKSPVSKPENLSGSLASAISSGKAQARITGLMQRIVDFERQTAAKEILAKIADAAALSESDRDKLLANIVSSEAQRVFRLMRYIAEDFKRKATSPEAQYLSSLLDRAVALDPGSVNGLTDEVSKSFAIACDALKRQISEDFRAGILNQDRMEMLIGGGPGAHAVATAIFQPRLCWRLQEAGGLCRAINRYRDRLCFEWRHAMCAQILCASYHPRFRVGPLVVVTGIFPEISL